MPFSSARPFSFHANTHLLKMRDIVVRVGEQRVQVNRTTSLYQDCVVLICGVVTRRVFTSKVTVTVEVRGKGGSYLKQAIPLDQLEKVLRPVYI